MAKDGSEATTHVGAPSGARSEAVPVEARLADAAFELLDCHDEGQVYTVAGDFLSLLIPRAIVIVNEAEPGLEHFVTRYVAGLDSTTLGKAADFAGFSIIGKRSAVSHALADQLLGSRLDRVEGGFPELASSEIPVAAGKVAVKAFGLSDTYTIGISDAHNTLGNIHIITRSPGTAIPVSLVESFARHCYSALLWISRPRRIDSSAE